MIGVFKKAIVITLFTILFPVVSGGAELPGEGVNVRPVEAGNRAEKFQHQILYRALEQLGFAILEPREESYQNIHAVLGDGQADFTAVHWDPLHRAFFEESGGADSMTRIGEYISGAVQGYLIDSGSYLAGIRNLGDLGKASIARRFDVDGDGKADLAGCAEGWGCERVIEHHLTEYGLRETVTHVNGDYDAILSERVARSKSNLPILYYTWLPYWVSGALVPGKNVEWIEVPHTSLPDGRTDNTMFGRKNLGFAVNSIRVVANNEFLRSNPAASRLFEVAELHINWVSLQNFSMYKGEDSDQDISRHVEQWIDANRKTFESWLEEARRAN